jgi:hypothetical protein
LSHVDKGIVLASAFEELANLNGVKVAERAVDLMIGRTPDFLNGSENAAVVFNYMYGTLREDDPDVLRAKLIAKSTGLGQDYDQIGGALTHLLFNQVIRERFRIKK